MTKIIDEPALLKGPCGGTPSWTLALVGWRLWIKIYCPICKRLSASAPTLLMAADLWNEEVAAERPEAMN